MSNHNFKTVKSEKNLSLKKSVGNDPPINQIEKRQTEELVIGFCGALGGGISTVANVLKEKIKLYNYQTNLIKVSHFIEDYIKNNGIKENRELSKKAKRIHLLQTGGNELRKHHGNDILSLLSVTDIATFREKLFEADNDHIPDDTIKKESIRLVHIIDGLKHPDEIRLLRAVYGNMFYLFGILCANPIRKNRLERIKEITSPEAESLMNRDESEDLRYGQKLIKTIQYADFFVRNNHENINNLSPIIERYIKLILGDPSITPTKGEHAMYIAQSAALRSACISRQVGAAITNKKGDIIATGCNDVPKFGGGLYSADDGDDDLRCMNRYNGKCYNSEHKRRIKNEILEVLKKELPGSHEVDDIADKISKISKLKGLIEFSRSVHAEMAAITTAARIGNTSLKHSILYCTTFPCHYCASHIIATGIEQVFYIEPYEKSLTHELYDDSIILEPTNVNSNNEIKKVIFCHFEGVAPRKYLDLFQYVKEKKESGRLVKHQHREALPTIPQFLDDHFDYESKVITYLKEKGIIEE
jgi:deoxycytidylate deaminase